MNGIFERWWQLISRRYFYSHLLLGIIAASFGIPINIAVVHRLDAVSLSYQFNRFEYISFITEKQILKQYIKQHINEDVGYWQQHLLKTVIRRFKWELLTQYFAGYQHNIRQDSKYIQLISTFNDALLNTHSLKYLTPFFLVSLVYQYHLYQPGLWLATTYGIRGDPS